MLQSLYKERFVVKLSEKILLAFCKEDQGTVKASYQDEYTDSVPSDTLKFLDPDLVRRIQGKSVCDFGSGAGFQAIAFARAGARFVVGIENNDDRISFSRQLVSRHNLSDRVDFRTDVDDEFRGKFDLVISQNSMEHFSDPVSVMMSMKSLLSPDGKIVVSFGPPWFAPYGGHMYYFTKLPGVHLLFPEPTVMAVRSRFRRDGAVRYEEVEAGLNKMSVERFERIVRACGLKVFYKRYDCVKGLNFLGDIPLVRELFINHITCILTRE